MTAHVALLRAVNLGSHHKLKMEDLVDLCLEEGFERVETFLQTGNIVFEDTGRNPMELERVLEAALARRFKIHTEVLVRSTFELSTLVAHNPYPGFAENDPSHLVVVFLKRATGPEPVEALQKAIRGPEQVVPYGAHLYAIYPKGIGRSKLTIALMEKKLGVPGTMRNWNTVMGLRDLAKA